MSGWACDQAEDVAETAAHFGQESWAGAITGAWLATNPGPRFPWDGTTEKAHLGRGYLDPLDATPFEAVVASKWRQGNGGKGMDFVT